MYSTLHFGQFRLRESYCYSTSHFSRQISIFRFEMNNKADMSFQFDILQCNMPNKTVYLKKKSC